MPDPRTYKARWAFPVDAPPLEDGEVAVDNGVIVAVGRGLNVGTPVDLGDVALLPGLVNAHAHLEFSDLAAPLGCPGMSFPDWIREVVALRRTNGGSRSDAVARGLAESANCGVTALGEIASPAWPREAYQSSSLAVTIFQEQLALAAERIEEKLREATEHLAAVRNLRLETCRAGLSPHAPYTVHPRLFANLVALAAQERAPLAFHLAESPEELELLATGGGPFRRLLDELGAWRPATIPLGARPLDYLQIMAATDVRGLVIHGNYLQADELKLLAGHAGRLSVVYCPRTHVYFRHRQYPLAEMLSQGVQAALGTDSRASNPDLNLWADMMLVAQQHPDVPLSKVLQLGTLDGARALGIDEFAGSIAVGKRTDFCQVQLPASTNRGDPHELLFAAAPHAATQLPSAT